MALTEQMSVRLSTDHKEYLQQQVALILKETGVKTTEGDIIRICIQFARTVHGGVTLSPNLALMETEA